MPLNFFAKAAITAGMMVANMALTMTRKINGPRLDDTKFNSGDYGAPIPFVWGKRRMTPPIFWGEDLREVKQRRKTKGGKFNEYTYFGTWAVALADHEIAGISRIWFDTHLVFDLTGAGPVTPFDFGDRHIAKDPRWPFGIGIGGTNYGDAVALYLGTETQEPDPRMQAVVEAANGEGSCPAYRGVAYIVFKDIPLEKLGNRIPQVSVEVLSTADTHIPSAHYDTAEPVNWSSITFSPDYARFAWTDGSGENTFSIWDTAARAQMISAGLSFSPHSTARIGVFNDGTMLIVDVLGDDIYSVSPDGFSAPYFSVPPGETGQLGARILADGNGVEHWGTFPGPPYEHFYFDGVSHSSEWAPTSYFADADGSIWVVGDADGAAQFQRLVSMPSNYPNSISITMPAGSGGACYAAASRDHFVLYWIDTLYIIDPLTGTLTTGATVPSESTFGVYTAFANLAPGAPTIWLVDHEYDMAAGALVRSATLPLDPGIRRSVYDPINHALLTNDNGLTWYFLDRVTSDGVTLQSVADDIADRCGVEVYDFTALDQTIDGWSVTQGDGQNMVEPLLDAYDSDIRPHDFTIQGLKRSGVSDGTILTEQFLEAEPRYSVPIKQVDQLPRSLTVSFADPTADQQVNNLHVGRPLDATDARGDQNVDLGTLALNPDDARSLGERYFRRMWNGRKEPANGLTAQYLALEPGDVRTLDLDGKTMIAQLRKLTVSTDDSLKAEWRYDHPSLAVLDGAAGATQDGRTPAEIAIPLISKGFVLDIPLLTDSDNSVNPILYTAAAPYASGVWPGATIFEGVDGEYSDEFSSIASSAQATWGYTTEAMADVPSPWCWDRGNSVNVLLQAGTLTGCTEADIEADPTLNLCLLGDELLNFTTATLEGDGSYTLSGFRRGRRGTEWATGSHVVNDTFLLMETAVPVETGLSDVGTDMSFKAATEGRTVTGAFPIDIEPYEGVSLKPYAPADVRAEKQENGDWLISWKWRTRVGGDWRSGVAPSSAEASLSFHVTLGDGVSSATKTVSSSPYTWDVATQTADTGGEVAAGALECAVAQISATVGDGWETSIAA